MKSEVTYNYEMSLNVTLQNASFALGLIQGPLMYWFEEMYAEIWGISSKPFLNATRAGYLSK